MTSTPKRKRIWLGLSGLYLLLLFVASLFYLLDNDLSTDDKVLTSVGVAGIPAVAFAAAAAPLWRASRNRALLRGASLFAAIAASFQLMLTFGFALPLSLPLLGLAAANEHRASRLRRFARATD
jgi:hypothetical protein